jgi:uncharacterized protein YdeI (YjbR/CyaY-like superfamily)
MGRVQFSTQLQWITEAKRDETRERRVQQAVEMIRAGKTRS